MLVVFFMCLLLHIASTQDEEESTEKPYQRFKGCRFDRFEEFPCLNRYELVDFANNKPRSFENLRLKMYFSDKRPIICLHNDENQLTFGFYKNSKTFGIFKSHKDWMTGQEPCVMRENVTLFSEEFYTEVDVTLTRDSRISIFVHGTEEEKGFMLTCRVCYKFQPEAITVRLSYNKQQGHGDLFFDCPF